MKETGKAFLELIITDTKPACVEVGVEPEWFFPVGPAREIHEELAKQVCQRCPVATECLQFGIDTGDAWAIMGGMTPEERRVFIKQMNRPFTPTTTTLEEAA